MTFTIELQSEKAFGRKGYTYEAFAGDRFVCHGWAAGSEQRARIEANEHAFRVERLRERARAAAITGEHTE